MKYLSRLFSRNTGGSLSTALERQRLSRTMPGQTAALAANRLGCLLS